MSELSSQFTAVRGRQISEPEFKRLCGQVWAESVVEVDAREDERLFQDKETALLKRVLVCLCQRLDRESDGLEKSFGSSEGQERERASLYRSEIGRLVMQNSAVPFDYNRIINRLLREIVQAETV